MAFSFFKKNTKSKAMVFVDYEHWYFALNNNYKLRPDIEKFCNDLNERYNVSELVFFGDFSSAPLNSEMHKIRGFTNKIVETNNGGGHFKKDFTDFIMLDHIYQSAYTDKDIDTYIIFTGDGHFSSSVLFLKNVCKKDVVVYGIKGAFSGQLKQASTSYYEFPDERQTLLPVCKVIMQSLYTLLQENKRARPTFIRTVQAVSEKQGIPEENVRLAMELLLGEGYVKQYEKKIGYKKVKLIKPDFKKAQKDKMFNPERAN